MICSWLSREEEDGIDGAAADELVDELDDELADECPRGLKMESKIAGMSLES
jgi:hypothetical protein